jgi:NADH-quinone oxidoreductase subunit D
MAFEKLLDVEVPRRAEYIRVLSGELNRVASHALFMGWMALDLGGLTPILWSFIERDEIVEMLAALTGQRMLFNYFRIGGVNGDLNHEFMSRLGDWMSRATTQIESNISLLNENEIFVRRMRGLGVIDSATALRMCMTGPNLRATGLPFDVRRAHPYSVYPELEFDIPVGKGEMGALGDCWDRFYVRVEECKVSAKILRQALEKIEEHPEDDIVGKLPKKMKPEGEAYSRVESARGDMGCYVIGRGAEEPYRARFRTGSFNATGIIEAKSPGLFLADLVALIASFDVVAPEIDR